MIVFYLNMMLLFLVPAVASYLLCLIIRNKVHASIFAIITLTIFTYWSNGIIESGDTSVGKALSGAVVSLIFLPFMAFIPLRIYALEKQKDEEVLFSSGLEKPKNKKLSFRMHAIFFFSGVLFCIALIGVKILFSLSL